MPSRKQFVIFITIIQSILFLAHLLLYGTWTQGLDVPVSSGIKLAFGLLSVSFIASSLLTLSDSIGTARAFC